MNRFKFRVWDREFKKMLKDCFTLSSNGNIFIENEDGDSQEYLAEEFGCLMQYTGLLDKNGVEVVEGDIVIEKSYPMYSDGLCNYRCVVVWNEEDASFALDMYCVSDRVRGCACPNSISEYTGLEVIGNIHQHAHLLEGGKNG